MSDIPEQIEPIFNKVNELMGIGLRTGHSGKHRIVSDGILNSGIETSRFDTWREAIEDLLQKQSRKLDTIEKRAKHGQTDIKNILDQLQANHDD